MIDLKTILQNHPNCLSSRASFRAILLDIYPDERRTINILLSMYESGIVRKIQSKRVLLNADVESILSFLENEYGISIKYTTEAVHIWARAYDIPIQEMVVSQPDKVLKFTTVMPERQSYIRQARTRSVRNYENSSNNLMSQYPQNFNPTIEGNTLAWETSVLPSGKLMLSKYVGVDESEVIVPNYVNGLAVTTIGSEAFFKCIGIKCIVIPEGIVEIQDGAFEGCTALESVILPSSLKRLGSNSPKVNKGVFEKTGLKQIILPEGLTYIATKAFKHCQRLRAMQIPNSVTELCAEAFHGCVALREVFLPNGMTFIGENAFSKTNLEDVYIPDGIREISNYTFYKCARLKNVSLPDNIEKIGDYAFAQSGLLFANIPDKTLCIGDYAFHQCKELKEVSLPQDIQIIGNFAFSHTAITNIKVPGSVSKITQNAFSNCEKLLTVVLYEGITKIDDYAFDDCKALREITIPMSVQKIGINAFKLLVKKNRYSTQPIREKNMNLVIACFPGSMGLEYARKNSYKTKNAMYTPT